MKLLDNTSSESSHAESEHQQPNKRELALEDSDSSADGTIRLNEKFAERFEKRKRAQELQVAKNLDLDLGSDGEDGSGSSTDSETEDEDAEMLTPALDLKIMKTINKIRSKDPDIYDTGKAWFSDDDGEGEGEGGEGEEDDVDRVEEEDKNPRPSQKPMRYKDVVREQILQARSAEEAISSDEDDESRKGGDEGKGRKELAYDEEQEELRRGFLGSVAEINSGSGGEGSDEEGEGGDGYGLLKVRQKTAAEVAMEEELLKKEAEKMADQGNGEEEDFLKDFVANRRWLDPHAKKTPSYDEILNAPHVEDSQDEEDVDRADEFESKYNFRFEEDGGREIAMHSRNVPGSMRRKDDRRKRERENRKARKAEERQRKEAELRRLKNLKREEIRKRLEAIQEMSGGALVDEGLGGADAGAGGEKGVGSDAQALLDGDFDPQRWDTVTQRAFGDGYYEAEDADDGWKPGDDPLEGLGDLDQYTEQPEAYAAGAVTDGIGDVGTAEEEVYYDDAEEEGEEESYGELDGEREADGAGGRLGTLGAQKEKLLDELYKLDYEDIIGDIPCRFKYTKVKPSDFGLSPEEILLADDKELKKYVPLKKLAPYRADEPKLDARRRRRLREEIKEREKAAEAELLALRAKKKRRGKRKAASSAASATAPAASSDVEPGDRANPTDVTAELAGGKRRRRKKGKKKQRAHTGGGGEDSDGVENPHDAADMVPRIRPMAPPSTFAGDDSGGLERGRGGWGEASAPRVSGGNDANDANDVNDAKGKRRTKRGRKRGRSSDGGTGNVENEGDGAAGAGVAHPAGDDEDAVAAADRSGPKMNSTEKNSEKIRRGSVGPDSGGSRERSAGKNGVGERTEQKAPKRVDASTAKLAKATGVSKSRLASYGL